MKKTTIYLIRHGQSIGNLKAMMLGHADLDLSPLGIMQADCTAKELSDVKFDAIYSSDLLRAYNTALPHAQMRGLEVIKNRAFRETFLGDWENTTVEEIRKDPEQARIYDVDWGQNFGTFTFPNGESTVASGERFYDALLQIVKSEEGKTILVTSHGAVIRAFWAKIANIAPENIASELDFMTNASYSILEFDGGNFVPVEYSHDAHLEKIGITRIKI